MTPVPVSHQPVDPSRPRTAGWMRGCCLLVVALCLGACSQNPLDRRAVASLSPLTLDEKVIRPAEVPGLVVTPDLLATDQAMRDFVKRYTQGIPSGRARVMSLHQAVRGSASLGIEYDASAEGTARDVFHRGTANCLSYATLFVALAREAGLDAQFQWLKVRPQWTVKGERVMVRVHVNVMVYANERDHFMVDIEPLPSEDVAGSRRLTDDDARALYHANIAMNALAEGQTEQAWLHSTRALQLSPGMAQLWVNIGAVYRSAGQHADAESSYLQALELDRWNDSAMNNLVVLYRLEGREEERLQWARRVEQYRKENPYYHAWKGDEAARQKEWQQARGYYKRALQLLPSDSRLLYSVGLTYQEMNEPGKAQEYIERAIEHATLRSDIEAYTLQLQMVKEDLRAVHAKDA